MPARPAIPLNDPVVLRRALQFMDQMNLSPDSQERSSDWKGRPEQWCALLDQLTRAQGTPLSPSVIAQVVHANPVPAPARPVKASSLGSFGPAFGRLRQLSTTQPWPAVA